MVFAGDFHNVLEESVRLNQQPMQSNTNSQTVQPVNQSQIFQPVVAGTQVIQLEPSEKQLQLCNSSGIILDVKDGSLLGRTSGDFVQQLGTIPVISSRHAQITKNDGKWFITDLHSTNKTYINNIQLMPDIPNEIKENDVIILANISFVARFK